MDTTKAYVLRNARLVNEGRIFNAQVLLRHGIIERIFEGNSNDLDLLSDKTIIDIDLQGQYLLPGIIDDQVHFRDPGLTRKGDLYTESKAAVAGGVTSFMEMPNTIPNALTIDLLEEKYQMAAQKSLANFSFYMGASNDNIDEILQVDPQQVCGIKVFMGASTGNMLVDDIDALNKIFSKAKTLVAVHCEDEGTIRENTRVFKEKYGDMIPIEAHPLIRSDVACYKSSKLAIGLARLYNTRLHILHLSTAKEMQLFENSIPLEKKKITAEVCVHHLWFNSSDYSRLGTKIKWNPAIKSKADQDELWAALLDDRLDVIATDHAPHTADEKNNLYLKAPSGGPLVQHSLLAMLDFAKQGKIKLEKVVEKMCHAPAKCFQVKNRGYIREGYQADLTVVDLNGETPVNKNTLLYKCGWSPFEGHRFQSRISQTFVNGHLAYDNGRFDESLKGQRLTFNR